MATDGPKALSLRELSEALDQDERTLRKWALAGCPHHKAPGRTGKLTFDQAEVVAWMRELGRTGQRGRPPAEVALLAPSARPMAGAVAAVVAGATGRRRPEGAEDGDEQGPEEVTREELMKLTAHANLAIKELEAQKRARLEREAEGEVVAVEEACRFVGSILAAVATELEALPGRVAAECAQQPGDVVFAVVERLVVSSRKKLAEQFRG